MRIKTLLLAAGIIAGAIPTAARSAAPGRLGTRVETLVASERARNELLESPADRSHQWLSFAAQLLARMAAATTAGDIGELPDLAAAYQTAMEQAFAEAQRAGPGREDALKLVRSFTERHQRALGNLLEQAAPGAKPALRRAAGSVHREQILALRAVGPAGGSTEGSRGSLPSPGGAGVKTSAPGKRNPAVVEVPAATGGEPPATAPVPVAPVPSVAPPVLGVSPLVVGVPVFGAGGIVPAAAVPGVNNDGVPSTPATPTPNGASIRPGVQPDPGRSTGTPGAVLPRPVIRPPAAGPPVGPPPPGAPPPATPPSVRPSLTQPPPATTPPGGAGAPPAPRLRR